MRSFDAVIDQKNGAFFKILRRAQNQVKSKRQRQILLDKFKIFIKIYFSYLLFTP